MSNSKAKLTDLDIPLIKPDEIPSDFADSQAAWLVKRAKSLTSKSNEPIYLLLYADDGVLWGRVENEEIVIPQNCSKLPKLRSLTVQQCRLFNSIGEIFIWREEEGVWRGREIIDEGKDYDKIDEEQILFGRKAEELNNAFTYVYEEGEGIYQVVPLKISQHELDKNKRIFLSIRHYFGKDEDGQLTIEYTRLRGLNIKELQ